LNFFTDKTNPGNTSGYQSETYNGK